MKNNFMDKEGVEIKPCPFCGDYGEVTTNISLDNWWVQCSCCKSCGQECDTDKEAVEVWNRRIK